MELDLTIRIFMLAEPNVNREIKRIDTHFQAQPAQEEAMNQNKSPNWLSWASIFVLSFKSSSDP